MKKILISTLLAASMLTLTACAVVPTGGRGGPGLTVVPLLPSLVVLDAEPYYFHNGYHYHYNNDRWYYSRSRSGPWTDLPRDHYPKEVRFKGRDRHHDRGRGDDDRGDDDRRYDGRGR